MNPAELAVRTLHEDDVAECLAKWADQPAGSKARIRKLLAIRPRVSVVAERGEQVVGWALATFNGFRAVIEHLDVWDEAPEDIRRALTASVEERGRIASPGGELSPPFDLTEAVGMLASTPGTLSSMLSALDEDWAERIPSGESWSPKDVVGHLILGERTDWIVRTRHILEHGPERPFEPFHREAMRSGGPAPTLLELLSEFATVRDNNLADLRGMGLDDRLHERGLHPALGPVTLGELLATWTAHDLSHVSQLSRILAARYRDAVGPWRDYLSILDR